MADLSSVIKWIPGEGSQNPLWMQRAMHELARVDDQTFAIIADNKELLLTCTSQEAVEKKLIENDADARMGWAMFRRMAAVFDMFMALAED